MLTPEQLTGRTHSHVIAISEFPCSLHPAAAAALYALRAQARTAGIDLMPVSAFRDYDRQRLIWNGKFRGERSLLDPAGRALDALALPVPARIAAILYWSALPGASRHHWGTDLDVVDRAALPPDASPQQLLLSQEYAPGGCFERLHDWLLRHGESYGFYHPYDRDRGGVQPEPWHLSYAPVADAALEALSAAVLREALEQAPPDGADVVYAQLEQLHARYVLAVAAPSPKALAAPAARGSGAL